MPSRDKKKGKTEKLPPLITHLAIELQPIEFTDVIYGENRDLFGGAHQYIHLLGMIALLNGFLFLFSGLMAIVFETREEFHVTGYVFTCVGGALMLFYVLHEWWTVRRSMNKQVTKK